MRRLSIHDRVQSRIFARKEKRRHNRFRDTVPDTAYSQTLYDMLLMLDAAETSYLHMKDGDPDLSNPFLISDAQQAPIALRKLNALLHKEQIEDTESMTHLIDPARDFKFLNRKPFDTIYLPPIRTRLKWDAGEMPFFKCKTDYDPLICVPLKEKRRMPRAAHCHSMMHKSHPLPTESWPQAGTLYLTNLRLFFNKNKTQRFSILYQHIAAYNFYKNALMVTYHEAGQMKKESFFIDQEEMPLVETMIRITL